MKKFILVLIPMLMIIGLFAVEFEISGENRVRAALANDANENDGGWVDNRFNIGFDSQFHRNLHFRIAAEIGNTVWGNGGGAISTGANINIMELFFDYYMESFDAKISVGQLYWMDKMGLVMDDYFSGILLRKDLGDNLSTEFAWMKAAENARYAADDHNVFMAHASMSSDIPFGAYLFYGQDDQMDFQNLTFMPYLSMEMDNMNFEASVFMDMQMNGDTEMGLGGAIKAGLNLADFELGADILVATENGLTTLSPWYQNGLYIYGIGKHHDGVNLYWNTPYEGNQDLFASFVGTINAPISEKVGAFAAAGYLIDLGMELNAGIEYELIPDLFHMSAYGAFGVHDNETNNYLFGTSLKLEF